MSSFRSGKVPDWAIVHYLMYKQGWTEKQMEEEMSLDALMGVISVMSAEAEALSRAYQRPVIISTPTGVRFSKR